MHHLKSLKPWELQEFGAPRWCKISSINSTIGNLSFRPYIPPSFGLNPKPYLTPEMVLDKSEELSPISSAKYKRSCYLDLEFRRLGFRVSGLGLCRSTKILQLAPHPKS